MEHIKTKKQFLGGFGSENMVEEFFLTKHAKLRPGTIISENEDVYKIELGIPFLGEKDIEVELLDDTLIVSGEGKMKEQNDTYKERIYKGVFHITDDVIKDRIEAKFNDGLLTIRFPKKKIQVKQLSGIVPQKS